MPAANANAEKPSTASTMCVSLPDPGPSVPAEADGTRIRAKNTSIVSVGAATAATKRNDSRRARTHVPTATHQAMPSRIS